MEHGLLEAGTSGAPGGCNNASPYQDFLDGFHLDALPATLPISLWRREPQDSSSAPDLVFTLRFE